MIQTLDSFSWIQQNGRPSNNVWTTPTHMQYNVTTRRSGQVCRGVYLRDACDLHQPLVTKISVMPQFRAPGNTIGGHTHRDRVEFQLRLSLSTTARWVQTPDQCLLASTGKSFDARIDPTGLAPGLHVAEIQGRSQSASSGQEEGPLFRFPVTVLIPEISPQQVRTVPTVFFFFFYLERSSILLIFFFLILQALHYLMLPWSSHSS